MKPCPFCGAGETIVAILRDGKRKVVVSHKRDCFFDKPTIFWSPSVEEEMWERRVEDDRET